MIFKHCAISRPREAYQQHSIFSVIWFILCRSISSKTDEKLDTEPEEAEEASSNAKIDNDTILEGQLQASTSASGIGPSPIHMESKVDI